MTIIEDTRNQGGKHDNINAQLSAMGYTVARSKLFVGDYTYATRQAVCIDTKQGLQEVAGNLTQQHERFREECDRAREAGIQLVILVEEAGYRHVLDVRGWENPRLIRWAKIRSAQAKGRCQNVHISPKPPISGRTLEKAMQTMSEKHGVKWEFCAPEETGARIIKILEDGNAGSEKMG